MTSSTQASAESPPAPSGGSGATVPEAVGPVAWPSSVDGASHAARLPALDNLRGIAALAVMLFHYSDSVAAAGTTPFGAPVPWGRYGVQLFFILSGYVILLTIRRARSAKDFVISRFARLYPAFWTGCVLTYSATLLFRPPGLPPGEALLNLPMFDIPHVRLIEGPYWTLRQELWFYVAMAGILALRRADMALRVVACIVVTSVCDLHFTRWFSLFLIGMVLFDSHGGFRRRHAVLLALCAIDILRRSLLKSNPDPMVAGWRYPMVVLVCTLMVAAATRVPWLSSRVLGFLGTISYPLYLLHHTIGQIIIDRAARAGLGGNSCVAVAVVCAIALASLVTYLVERPALRAIKKRLVARGPGGVQGGPAAPGRA